jgi:hypothetical protein
MGDDPTFQWTLASRYGIQVDEKQDAWHSGHVNDLLELDSGGLLVATQTGGVWSIDTNGDTLPLSDSWEDPDVNCLAFGPDGPQHVFAGCTRGIIRETDLGEALPLIAWKQVATPLPAGAGAVHRIVVIRSVRRIVAACDGGVFWSEIPSSNGNRGCLSVFMPGSGTRQPFDWKPAKGMEPRAPVFGISPLARHAAISCAWTCKIRA